MAGNDAEFIAVVNDTDASFNHTDKSGKSRTGGKAYSLKITGNNHAQMLGKRIGDVMDGLFVGEGGGEESDADSERKEESEECSGEEATHMETRSADRSPTAQLIAEGEALFVADARE